MKIKPGLICILMMIISAISAAQSPGLDDYKRAVAYQWGNLLNKKVFNVHVQPIWFSDSTGVAYVINGKKGKIFHKIVFDNAKPELLFDQDKLAKLLTEIQKKEVKGDNLPIQGLSCKNTEVVGFNFNNKSYEFNTKTNELLEVNPQEINEFESKSPDGKWIVYTENYNLYLKSIADGKVKPLSTTGKRLYEFGTYYGWSDIITGEDGERPKRFSASWSPDSKWIQTYITDFRVAEKMYLLDWSIDSLYKPKLLSYYRGSPGDTTMVRMIPVFYNIETGEEYIKHHLQSTHTNPIQYEWSKQNNVIYQENAIRGYQAVELHRCDLGKKNEELLYRETSKTNIDNYSSLILEDIGKVLITSERDGWKQLYMLDIKDKSLHRLTKGNYYVNQILHNELQSGFILFTASGKEPGRNPYHQHMYKYSPSTGTTLLTPEDANHEISISPDGKWYVDNISTINQPTRTILKSTETNISPLEISKTDVSDMVKDLNFKFADPFTSTARDGKTTIFGAIWKPTNFDETKKYPVIDQSYTGPHTFMYPRSFISSLSRSNQALAELGFIVITVDGMGTANRSKEFHNVSYKNMGKNLEDHKLAILELGRKYSWIDTTRVGIFGHSAGGYDAGHALLEYPEFYKVGVASSADHDFRMEKDWWPEMYMGWPVDSTYHKVSNITMAGNLKGKLLITHGGIDENVNPSATFKLAEALIRANKEFDMLILPSQRHGYFGIHGDYFTKKRWNYFVQHLLGAEPIWGFEMK